jgi:two-component system, NtrC family, response regulator AtoC
VARHAARHRLPTPELPADVLEALQQQPWAGNVRELENVIERALVLADGPVIDLPFLQTVMTVRGAALPTETDTSATSPGTEEDAGDPSGEVASALSIKKATRDLEAELIKRALGVTGGNRTNAAKLLEISHRALLYKLKEYGIS